MILIDPFNYFGISSIIPDTYKAETSYRLNYRLWKMNAYRQQPTGNILLGDSRMLLLDADSISARTGQDYFNFAYGGGSLDEAIETFWFADSITSLQNVYIGLNFPMFNGYHTVNLTRQAKETFANPMLYFIDKVMIKAGAMLVARTLFDTQYDIERPDMTPEQFWKYQIAVTAQSQFERYLYPDNYYQRLSEIVSYCNQKKITVNVIIFPEHVDLINRYSELGLDEEYARFKEDIHRLVKTFDFNYGNPITENRADFTDPYHFTTDIGLQLVDEIWQ
ncbi:MAG: hypothetical protein JW763_07715 [candidate division Zixibacteria bacterium]|nr:hypothetical protein [candidate division Zixibacteria bacterium]